MPRQVTAFSNATVKRLRSLRDKKARREEGLFLAEGLRIIAEARDSGRLPEIIAFSASGADHPLAGNSCSSARSAPVRCHTTRSRATSSIHVCCSTGDGRANASQASTAQHPPCCGSRTDS